MTHTTPGGETELLGFSSHLRRDWKIVLVVAGIAALVRIICLIQLHGTPFGQYIDMDAAGYNNWALSIAHGSWLGDKVFYQEPLYPYLLAIIHLLFGPGLVMIFVVQLFAGVVTCVLVQILAARLSGSWWAGLIAGLLLALYRTMVFYEAQVLKVVWGGLLLMVAAHVLISAWERLEVQDRLSGKTHMGLWFLAGLLLAMLGLIQGNLLLCVPFVLAWILVTGWRWSWVRLGGVLGLIIFGIALPLSVVMLRNYIVGGEVVLSSSHAGFNFFIGNNENADGTYQYVDGVREDPRFEGDDARILASRQAGRNLKLSESSAFWFSQAGRYIRAHPAQWLKLMGVKVMRFLNHDEVMDTWSPEFFAQHAPMLRLAFVTYEGMMPLALVGVFVFFRRGARGHLVNLLVLSIAFSVILFYVFGRYRMPVVPLFAVLAGGAVMGAARCLRDQRYLHVAAAVVGIVLSAIVGLMPIHNEATPEMDRAAEHVNLGLIYITQAHDLVKARGEFESALRVSPGFAKAMRGLGSVSLLQGRLDEAEKHLQDSLAANPNAGGAHCMLGDVYRREGKVQLAVFELEEAIRLEPGNLEAYQILTGIVIGSKDATAEDYAKVARLLKQALDIDPQSETTWKSLGICYYGAGNIAKARKCLDRALILASTDEEKQVIRKIMSRLPASEMP